MERGCRKDKFDILNKYLGTDANSAVLPNIVTANKIAFRFLKFPRRKWTRIMFAQRKRISETRIEN
jgi:hypothetical protein